MLDFGFETTTYRVMTDDSFAHLPDGCDLSEEAGQAITDWAKVAYNYLAVTDKVAALLVDTFSGRREMEQYHREVKYYLRQGLPDGDRETLRLSESIKGKVGQTADEKAKMDARAKVIARLTRLYNKLRDEVFPRMDDDDETVLKRPIPKSPRSSLDEASVTGTASLTTMTSASSSSNITKTMYCKKQPHFFHTGYVRLPRRMSAQIFSRKKSMSSWE